MLANESNSAQLYARASRVLPGGTSRSSTFDQPFPLYAAVGRGARIVDIDGRDRLDFHANFTAMMVGHAHPAVIADAAEQLAHGTSFGLATEKEVLLAEEIVARVPTIEKIRFMCSGSEAAMMAVKAARAYTGRSKIAKVEGAFHGSYDYLEVSYAPTPAEWGEPDPIGIAYAAGTPSAIVDDVVVIPFNDPERAISILKAHADELAGIVVDYQPNRVGLIPASEEYLRALRSFATESGALLISDEVINFRLGYGGAQPEFSTEADLTVLGKVIGGGFPIGAVGGRAEYMQVFDPTGGHPPLPQSGTFAANPVAMAAGLRTLKLLDASAFRRLNGMGERLRRDLREALGDAGIEGQVTGAGSIFRIHFTKRPLRDYRSAYATAEERRQVRAFYAYLLEHGILITSVGMGCLSTPMEDADLEQFLGTAAEAFRLLARDPARFISEYA